MQTFALPLAFLAAAATAAAAEPPASPAGAPTPQFSASDEIPDRSGHDDAFALYEVKLGGEPMTSAEQITRWHDELKAGRARAGALVGSNLAYLALTPADCAAARDALTRADELGSDQAAWQLAQLADNRSCGGMDVDAKERWLKKAVTLDYLIAAQRLIELYAPTGPRTDLVQQYVYARVAGGYWEAVYGKDGNPGSRAGFDVAALQEMEKSLPPADRKRAEDDATRILTQMLKRHERFTPLRPQEFSRGGQAAKASRGWGFVAQTIDYYHECAWNLSSNCRGAQRLAYADVSNNEQDFMSCKAVLQAKDFVTGKPGNLSRVVLIGPKTTRRLVLGDVYDQPDKGSMAVTCTAVPKLAENAAAGKCRARLEGSIDAQQFYPASAKNAGIEGDAVVRFWVPPGSDVAEDAEIVRSSGYPALDGAALDTIRSGKFKRDCDYGLSSIRIAFKLQD
ncbi:MAG TPA: energy transducer TonB [Steroidobacteraceae bacterium]|nr:energy transducer TonB [Steroidobacteraceae bacterium]